MPIIPAMRRSATDYQGYARAGCRSWGDGVSFGYRCHDFAAFRQTFGLRPDVPLRVSSLSGAAANGNLYCRNVTAALVRLREPVSPFWRPLGQAKVATRSRIASMNSRFTIPG